MFLFSFCKQTPKTRAFQWFAHNHKKCQDPKLKSCLLASQPDFHLGATTWGLPVWWQIGEGAWKWTSNLFKSGSLEITQNPLDHHWQGLCQGLLLVGFNLVDYFGILEDHLWVSPGSLGGRGAEMREFPWPHHTALIRLLNHLTSPLECKLLRARTVTYSLDFQNLIQFRAHSRSLIKIGVHEGFGCSMWCFPILFVSDYL